MGTKRIPTLDMAKKAITTGKMIGAGSYRKVYGTQYGKWVFKVNKENYPTGGNVMEYNTYLDYKNIQLPEGVKIPEMHMLPGGILAAERIRGRHPKNWCESDDHSPSNDPDFPSEPCPGLDTCWAEKVKGCEVADLHPYNVKITKDGTIYLIDLGHGNY